MAKFSKLLENTLAREKKKKLKTERITWVKKMQ